MTVANHSVQVWLMSLRPAAAKLKALSELLNDEERQRAARFRFDRDRDRFIAARGNLRVLLGWYLNRPANLIQFRYGPHGKPELVTDEFTPCLQFNLSHSHELGLCAVVCGRRVGVDVERLDRNFVSSLEIADQFFTEREKQLIRSGLPDQRTEVFLRIWTRKEAYLKGRGDGISASLNQFEVSLDDSRVRAIEPSAGDAAQWSLHEVQPCPGYIAAVAVEGQLGVLTLSSMD